MALIKIKAQNEAIYAEYQNALAVKNIWEDRQQEPNTRITIGDFTFTKSDIKWINLSAGGGPKIQSDDIHEQASKQYLAHRQQKLAMTPDERAKCLEMFTLFAYCITKKNDIPEAVKQKAIVIQQKFFSEHPKRIHCDPILFRPLFPSRVQAHLDDMRSGGFRSIESAIGQDMYWARKN